MVHFFKKSQRLNPSHELHNSEQKMTQLGVAGGWGEVILYLWNLKCFHTLICFALVRIT